MKKYKLLLADDHRIFAEALANYLRDECELVGIVEDGIKLIDAARKLRPDVVITDISMPVLSGMEAMRRLRQLGIQAKIIFLTMYSDAGLASEAVLAGASGYLPKNSAGEELLSAIREVMAGRIYVSPEIAGDVITSMANRSPMRGKTPTPRQRDVLRLIAMGLSVKQVAAELDLSPRTVETHKYEMMHNLGMQSTADLVHYAIRCGLVAC
jgi:DNA-binding NarL/FixJ family response regulator